MNLTKLLLTVDDCTNIRIPVNSSPAFVDFVKSHKLTFDIIVVICSIMTVVIIGILMTFMNRGLRLHFHLRALIFIAYLDYCCFRAATDAPLILAYIFPTNQWVVAFGIPQNLIWFKFIELIFAATFIFFLTALIFERLMATVMINTYESQKSYLFVMVLTVSILVLGFGFSCTLFFVNNGFIVVIIALAVAATFQAGSFFYITVKNKKLYATRVTSETRMTLSQRYQLSENLRIVLFFRNLFGLYFGYNLIVLAAFFVYWLSDDLYFKLFINFIWQILIFIYAGFLIFVFSSAGVWPTVMELWKKLVKGDLTSSPESTCNQIMSIKSSIGEQMMFQLDQEADVYFGQLTQSWGSPK